MACIAFFADIPNFSGVFYVPLHQNSRKMDKELINRIKVVLAEKNLTNKWLAEQLGKDRGLFQNGRLIQVSQT